MHMRKSFKAFGRGDIQFLSPSNAKILAFTRSYEDETILVLANLSRFSQAVELELDDYIDYIPVEVFSHNKFPRITNRPYLFTLAPHGYYWFSLTQRESESQDGPLTQVKTTDWERLFDAKNIKLLERKILPAYFKSKYWFGDTSRIIQSMEITNMLDLSKDDLLVKNLIVEVHFNEGLPEMYQLPVSYIANSYESLTEAVPQKGILAEVHFKDSTGILVDSVYVEPFRAMLFYSLQAGATLKFGKEKLAFERGNITPDSDIEEVSSRIIESKQSNTSIIYDHRYFLKLYRRLDSTVNPDAELSQYLTETVKFANTPDYMGKLVYYTQKRNEAVLGMMQDLVTNVGTGWVNAKDAAHRYMERIETQAQELEPAYDKGLRTKPLLFEDLKEPESDLVESLFPERISLLGRRSAQMHQALASHKGLKGFEHEAFSLHYQRSLYSSLQSVTREAFENLRRSIPSLPATIQAEAEAVLKRKNEVLDCFKRVFKHKINTVKIRTHGDFQLGQLLWTGKDFVIINFEGEPSRPFSERRILRSGLRDVAAMIRSFHYAAYSPLMQQNYAEDYRETHLEAWAEAWYYYVSRFYLDGYISTLKGSDLIPDTERDYQVLLETFLLEKAVGELNTELNHRPLFALVALRGIQAVLDGAHKD